MDKMEKLIREKRILEATKKDLMGSSGKLGTIVKYLGEPIIRQGATDEYFSIDDLLDLEQDEAIPVGEDAFVYQEGWVFDGLSRGLHLEIKYLDTEKKLTCSFKGFTVYEEIAGDLMGYAPFDEWEKMIDSLFKLAKERQKTIRKENKELRKLEIEEEKVGFLQRMRMKWGI